MTSFHGMRPIDRDNLAASRGPDPLPILKASTKAERARARELYQADPTHRHLPWSRAWAVTKAAFVLRARAEARNGQQPGATPKPEDPAR